MAQTEHEFVGDLIKIIANAEQTGSITNDIVARVLDYLFKAGDNTNIAVADLSDAQNLAAVRIQYIQNQLNSIIDENASAAIDTLNEIISFLDGFKNSDSLAARLKELSDRFGGLSLKVVTEAEHETMVQNGSLDNQTLYFIPEE